MFSKIPPLAGDIFGDRYSLGGLYIHEKQTYGEWIPTAKYYLHFYILHLLVEIK